MTFSEFHIEKREAFYLVQPPLDLIPSIRELDNLRRQRLKQNVFQELDSVTSTFENRTDPNLFFTNLISIIASSETKMQLTFQRHGGCGQLHRDFYGKRSTWFKRHWFVEASWPEEKFLDSVRLPSGLHCTWRVNGSNGSTQLMSSIALWNFKSAMIASIEGTIS